MKESIIKFCVMLLAFCTSAIHLQAMDEWDGKTIAKGFYSGTGTKADPYRIFTASQFLYFIQQTKDGNTFSGKYIELCNDIAFSHEAVRAVTGGDFYGDFDGNDHTIQVERFGPYNDWHEYGWRLFNLYGSMHDVQFVRANGMMSIYTGGILYNCIFEYPNNSYHGYWTIYLQGGTIANCVSNSANFRNSYKYGGSYGLVYGNESSSYCSNCYFPITSYSYGGTLASNYYGVKESCGEEAGNDWVLSHTERDYKSWPLTFNPTYPEYQIKEQPKSYNPSVVCPNSDEALYQWCYQERKPITFEDITFSSSTQTKNIVVSDNDVVLSFDFIADGYIYTGYNDGNDYEAWISVNGEKIVSTYYDKVGTYSCQASVGTYEISCERSTISNICIIYPTETLANETSNVLSKQTIMGKPGAYFCQVSYGEGCDVMNSDYVDYEKLLTINNVTYVINEDATATVLWVADMAVNITIPETVCYDGVNYPVTSISSKAFVDCTSLASIKCKTSDVPALLGGATFEGLTGIFIPSNITLYVPAGSVDLYLKTAHWRNFNIIEELPVAESVVLDKTSVEMTEGESLTLTATVMPENATDKTVVWTSSDKSVATVDNGVVTALKAGKATITAKAGEVSATCELTVNAKVIPATGIALDKTTAELTEGETLTLTATVTPEDATDKTVTWTSSDETVATVKDGVVTALKAGQATITAKAGDVSATCELTVNPKVIPATGIALDKTTAELTEGETLTLTATVTPEDATDKTVTWTSSDETIATVANGVVTAFKAGKATITAKAGEVSATCELTVNAKVIPATGIALDKTTAEMIEGETLTLTATVTPEDATDKTVIWTSSDETVATVKDGVVTALKAGKATITAKAGDVSATCEITVNAKVIPATGIALDKTTAELTEGETLTLTATVTPEDATDKTVTWTSSDETVATVKGGVVTALKAGKATITAKAGEVSATCELTVNAKVIPATGITLDKTTAELTEGEILTLTATVTPQDATDKTVTWTSSDETVATVKDGVVTALKAGKATITAKAGDVSATCELTVNAKVIPATGIALDKTTAELTEGETLTLTATVTPEEATDKTVVWTSSDETVATVANGVVTALKAGKATITAKAGDVSATCEITVNAKVIPATGIALDKTTAEMTEGETLTLTATVTPEDATDKTVKWTSSDETVAKVVNGVVSALKTGKTTITAKAGEVSATCEITVIPVTGINGVVCNDGYAAGNVYTVAGNLVCRKGEKLSFLPKGLYIVDGKKIVVK